MENLILYRFSIYTVLYFFRDIQSMIETRISIGNVYDCLYFVGSNIPPHTDKCRENVENVNANNDKEYILAKYSIRVGKAYFCPFYVQFSYCYLAIFFIQIKTFTLFEYMMYNYVYC